MNLHVIKKDKSHPKGPNLLLTPIIMNTSHNIFAQLIHPRFGHGSHQRFIQMAKLRIYTGLPKYNPKIPHPWCAFLIDKRLCLPRQPNISIEHLDLGTCFHLDFIFFNKVSCKKITSTPTIDGATTIHLFVCTKISKHPQLQLIRILIQFSFHHGYKISILHVYEGGDIYRS